ncbi:site-specific integrase [Subtercola vilae]|uniref:Integrase n=1 Tax=Subtercola vilae TaxID=2056433 RepID=A0A4T2BTQ0_9MICO|nr:site-specific integrase [Subtercola vilae]TIH33811.1 integrase [Subtercola vilae]
MDEVTLLGEKKGHVARGGGGEVAGAVRVPVRSRAEEFAAPNTVKGYRSDLRRFRLWLARMDHLPPGQIDEGFLASPEFDTVPVSGQTVADYLDLKAEETDPVTAERKFAASTIVRWVAAIGWEHLLQGWPSPVKDPAVVQALKVIRRTNARPTKRAAPLLLDPLRKTLLSVDISGEQRGVLGARDVALILFGWVGAFRGSELAALQVKDVTVVPGEGLRVRVTRSKTDQEGRGGVKALPFGSNPVTCAPCAYTRWYRLLAAQGDRRDRAALMRNVRENTFAVHVCREPLPGVLPGSVPLFRAVSTAGLIRDAPITGDTVSRAVKRRSHAAGIDVPQLSGHSLRAGFITEALNAGASTAEVMRQSLHRDERTILIYDRENNPLKRNAVTRVRL